MKIISAIVFFVLAVVAGAQAQEFKGPVERLYHGNVYTFTTTQGEEVKVSVSFLPAACKFEVTRNLHHRQVILKEEKTSLLVGMSSPEVHCNDMVQLHLLKNTMPEGWVFKGGERISRLTR